MNAHMNEYVNAHTHIHTNRRPVSGLGLQRAIQNNECVTGHSCLQVRSISEISSCFFGPRPWHIEIRHRVNKNIHN